MRKYSRVNDIERGEILAYHRQGLRPYQIRNLMKRDDNTIKAVIKQGRVPKEPTPRRSPLDVLKRRKLVMKLVEEIVEHEITWKVWAGQKREETRRKMFVFPRFPTAYSISRELFKKYRIRATPWTVNHDLIISGYKCMQRRKVVSMDPALWLKRLTFAKATLKLRLSTKFSFADECIVTISLDSTVVFHYRRRGQRPLPRLATRPTSAKEKVHVWIFIGPNYRQIILFNGNVNATVYCDECLSSVEEYIKTTQTFVIHDNASAHKCFKTSVWIEEHGLTNFFLDFPVYSPDANCAEEVFPNLKRAVSARFPTASNLSAIVREEFMKLPQQLLNNIMGSFRKKLERIVSQEGKHF